MNNSNSATENTIYEYVIYERILSDEEKSMCQTIMSAMRSNLTDYVFYLLENIPDTVNSKHIVTLLLVKAIRERLSQFIIALIRYGANPDSSVQLDNTTNYTTALYEAVRMNNISTVKKLCYSGSHCVEPKGNREKLLFLAAMNGNAVIVKLLLTSGADYHGISSENKTIYNYEQDDHDKYLLANCNVQTILQKRSFLSNYTQKSC